jgi:hypothetical protein
MPEMPRLFSLENVIWYVRTLPADLDLVVLVLCFVGTAFVLVNAKDFINQPVVLIPLCFLVSSWVFFTLISNKDPRFNLPSLPFLLIIAVVGWYKVFPRHTKYVFAFAAACTLFTVSSGPQGPRVTGFRAAAHSAANLAPTNTNIIISANRDGNFIFNFRTQSDRRDVKILRADKTIVDFQILPQFGMKNKVADQVSTVQLLDQEKVAIVIAQTDYLASNPSMRVFSQTLENQEYFEKIGTLPISGNTAPGEVELVIFRRKAAIR